jgi:ribosome assembly protein YihI (activator of Der GTPase)
MYHIQTDGKCTKKKKKKKYKCTCSTAHSKDQREKSREQRAYEKKRKVDSRRWLPRVVGEDIAVDNHARSVETEVPVRRVGWFAESREQTTDSEE